MSQKSFMSSMSGYAMTAGAALGMPYQVILAQWAHESAYGTSDLANRAKNYAGIKYNDNADFKSGAYAGYNNISKFVSDYIRVMRLPYYNNVRNADGIRETIEELGKSPYAEDKSYKDKLLSIVDINDTSPGLGGNLMAGIGGISNIISSPFLWVGLFLLFLFKR